MKTRLALACSLFLALALDGAALDQGYDTVEFSPAHLGGMHVKFNIILPRDYASSERRYPVLYLLHGYTDDYSAWVTKSNLLWYAPAYEEIIVMPEGGTGFYVNNQGNPKLQWEDYLIQDLIPYVDTHYRTVAAREGRAIAGLSMGGYGAMTLGLRHPDMFAAIASMSGALATARSAFSRPITDPKLKKVLQDDFGALDNPLRAEEDPFELIKKIPADKLPDLYFSIGSSDFLLKDNLDFLELLTKLKVRFRYSEVPGPHEWPVWDEQIRVILAMQAPIIGAAKAWP
jgi:putative tributyrin esterase